MDATARFPLSFAVCRWLLIPVVTLHNAEEWLTVPHYGSIAPALQAHAGGLLAAPPVRVLQIGWIVVTLLPALIVMAAAAAGRSRLWDGLVCWVTSLYFANAIVPHLLEFAISRTYAPGIVTAAFITLPFTVVLLRRALAEQRLSARQLALVVTAGFVAQPLVLALVFAIASALVSR